MHDERGLLQKTNDFIQAFLEFLGRPKTIFDLKDRGRLLLILILVIVVPRRIDTHTKTPHFITNR